MITTITTRTGRTVHVAPDDEPIFSFSEIEAMKGMDPDAAELTALVKEVFSGSKVVEHKFLRPVTQPSCTDAQLKQEDLPMARLGFNAAEAEEMDDFSPIPAADYIAAITESDMCPTSAGTGHYLKLKFTILEGPYANRVVFANLNLDNPNQQAVDIARSELKSICSAIGKGDTTINDSEELHDQPMTIKVVVEPRKDKPGESSNKIKKYSAVGGGQSQQTRTTTSPKTGAKKPWER